MKGFSTTLLANQIIARIIENWRIDVWAEEAANQKLSPIK
jgi:hypothetical protein